LNSFPEAYPEFKKSLLGFLFCGFDPMIEDYSISKLSELAENIESTIKYAQRLHSNKLSCLMSYLVHIHNNYYFMEGTHSPLEREFNDLILHRLKPPFPLENGTSKQEKESILNESKLQAFCEVNNLLLLFNKLRELIFHEEKL
jgi:hypothetical protein